MARELRLGFPSRWTLGSCKIRSADFTEHERQVLALSNAAIAKRLFITERTVEEPTTQIFQKLHLEANAHTAVLVDDLAVVVHKASFMSMR